jgi:hypothetical protein
VPLPSQLLVIRAIVAAKDPALAGPLVSTSSPQPPTPREGVRLQAQYDAFRLFLQPDTNAERLSQVPANAVLRVLEDCSVRESSIRIWTI